MVTANKRKQTNIPKTSVRGKQVKTENKDAEKVAATNHLATVISPKWDEKLTFVEKPLSFSKSSILYFKS